MSRRSVDARAGGEVSPLPIPLSRLAPGQVGTISHIDHHQRATVRKLLALGLLPGVTVRLSQVSRACVLRIGRTQLALDTHLAEAVRVRVAER